MAAVIAAEGFHMAEYQRGIKEMKVLLIYMVRFYQKYISPLKGASTCRFRPTCSQYAVEALQKYGALKGTWLSIRRLLKCHPFNKSGWTYDPVP